jgi:hypothetical protein
MFEQCEGRPRERKARRPSQRTGGRVAKSTSSVREFRGSRLCFVVLGGASCNGRRAVTY